VDLSSGGHEPTGEACKPAASISGEQGRRLRILQRTLQESFDEATDEIYCSSGTTITSRGTFRKENPCPSRLGFRKQEGVSIGSIRRVHDGGWLVLGNRYPGTRSPMIGVARRGTMAWIAEVGEGHNRLELVEGQPSAYALAADRVFAIYRFKDNRPAHL